MKKVSDRKTGKAGRCLGWMISVLLVFALAWGVVFMYPTMTREAQSVYQQYRTERMQEKLRNYLGEVYPLIDGMYVDWYKNLVDDNKTAGEIILDAYQVPCEKGEEYAYWYSVREEILSGWYENTYPRELETSGIKYFVYSGSTNNGLGTIDPLSPYENTETYPFFVQLTFNENGVPVVEQERGISNAGTVVEREYRYQTRSNQFTHSYSEDKTEEKSGFTGITALLVCEEDTYKSLGQNIVISEIRMGNAVEEMKADYILFLLVAVTILLALGLLLPSIRPLGLSEGWKAHIPLEILIAATVGALALVVNWLPEFIVQCRIEIEYPGMVFYWIGIIKDIMADGRATYIIQGLHVIIWFVLFFFIYLCIINVRQLFAKGLFRFFKENTLTGRVSCLLWQWGKKTVVFCGTIDFTNKGNRNFLLAVALNFAVIALLCCTWFVGILLAVPYSVLVFWLLQKWWNKIRTDYAVMLSTTEEMARGITDVEYVAEAGIFHELNSALSGVQEGFHAAVQEEVKSQKMKTELITNVSHDLKTPLTAIITYVDLLKDDNLPTEERQSYVEVLERKSARLKTLIEDLFEISKAASGDLPLDKVDLDLVQLIQEVQLELEDEIMNAGISFKVNLPEEKAMVHLDAQKTCRIFENLTMNIIKHGLTGSRAYVSLEETEKTVRVVYKNVSAAEINFGADEILERFTRGDVSRNTEGSGLGLAIVKSFTEAQDGKVIVDLEDDIFKVTICFPKVITE